MDCISTTFHLQLQSMFHCYTNSFIPFCKTPKIRSLGWICHATLSLLLITFSSSQLFLLSLLFQNHVHPPSLFILLLPSFRNGDRTSICSFSPVILLDQVPLHSCHLLRGGVCISLCVRLQACTCVSVCVRAHVHACIRICWWECVNHKTCILSCLFI